METYHIARYSIDTDHFALSGFEEAVHHTSLMYSIRHLIRTGITSPEHILEALNSSLEICTLAGIPIRHHFKQVYVFDPDTGAVYTDWLMSRRGFNLMMMQAPALNKHTAHWLWEISQ